jgi:hypothetical protein
MEALTPEILRGGEVAPSRFDPKSAAPFVNKSVSEATRRAYGRALREFFQSAGMKHPLEVVPQDVLLWRDKLRSQKKSAATVSFKLSVIRSFFEYLKAAGGITLNPASTKLVSPLNCRRSRRGERSRLRRCVTFFRAQQGEAGRGERLRPDAGDASPLTARLRGLLAESLVRQVEPRAVDAAV